MIDLHCHILPGIDDGPTSMEETLALARAAVAGGTRTIVATPHVSWEYAGNDASRIAAGVAAVRAALAEAEIPLEVLSGAEIAMTRVTELTPEELVALRLGGGARGGTTLLVECPLTTPSAAGFAGILHRVRAQGNAVLLAHPERCPAFQRDPAALAELVADGMHTQVTAGALVGRFGKPVRLFAERLLDAGLVHVVASDAHSVDRRPPSMREELAAAGLEEPAGWYTEQVPAAILAGEPLPPLVGGPARRRGLGRMLRGR